MRPNPWSVPLVAVAVFGVATYCLYPGWYSFDSAYLLHQARTGLFSDQQPPAMALIWSWLIGLGAPPGSLLPLHIAAYSAGALMLGLSVRAVAGIAFPLLLLWPPFLATFGHLWTDVSLAASLVLAAGWIAWTRSAGRTRLAWLAALALIYAVATRHNAVFAIPPFYFVLIAQTPGVPKANVARAALAACLTVASYGIAVILSNSVVAKSVPAWTSTAIWDLSAASVASGRMLLPDAVHGPAMSVEELRSVLNPHQSGTILLGTKSGINAGVVESLPANARRDLLARWVNLPFTDTAAWLRHRLNVARSLFWRQGEDKPEGLFIEPGVVPYGDNPPIEQNRNRANAAVVAMARAMRTTSWCAPIGYLLLSIAAIGLTYRRGFAGDRPLVACLFASAWMFAVPLVFLAPSTDWRYCLWPMMSSAIALVVALAGTGFGHDTANSSATGPATER